MINCTRFHLRTFNDTEHYQFTHEGPIKTDTIITLDAATGKPIESTGANMFYMPHGMTIDRHGNYWITDVALHQVFKFKPGAPYPSITLGRRFQPGSLPNYFCKPTDVAVASTGEVNLFCELCLTIESNYDYFMFVVLCSRWLL